MAKNPAKNETEEAPKAATVAKKMAKPTIYRSIDIDMTIEQEELGAVPAKLEAKTAKSPAKKTASYKEIVKKVVKIDLDNPPASASDVKKASQTDDKSEAYKAMMRGMGFDV